jgi:hypothetical protein
MAEDVSRQREMGTQAEGAGAVGGRAGTGRWRLAGVVGVYLRRYRSMHKKVAGRDWTTGRDPHRAAQQRRSYSRTPQLASAEYSLTGLVAPAIARMIAQVRRYVQPMKIIANYSKPEEAHMARARLEGHGVPAEVRDDLTVGAYWFLSNAVGGVKLAVKEEDEEAAREVLDLPPSEEGMLQCPACGSQNVKLRELSWTAGIAMALGFVVPVSSRKVDCRDCGQSFELAEPEG